MSSPRLDTTADRSSQSSGAGSDSLISNLVRGLSAYRQELQLYPPEHPRLVNRIESLFAHFTAFFDGGSEKLMLEVGEQTLLANQGELDQKGPAGHHLNACLRERMVHTLQVSRGVTREEIRGLCDLLTGEPDNSDAEERTKELGPHIELYFFQRTFGDDEDVPGKGGGLAAEKTKEKMGPLVQELSSWEGRDFDPAQLRSIAQVMLQEGVLDRFRDIADSSGNVEQDHSFAAVFFDVLRQHGQTDWNDPKSLRETSLAGLDLLQKAKREYEIHGALPAKLLTPAPGEDSPMDIHLRWKLLRQFFPEIRENRSPRAAEDLAYLTDGNSNTSESLKLPRDGWKKIDLDVLRKKFFRLFDAEARLKDHTWVVSELVRLSPNVSPDSIRKYCLDHLKTALPTERQSVPKLAPLFAAGDTLPEELRLLWNVEVVRGAVLPEDVLDVISQLEQDVSEFLLKNPPHLDHEPRGSLEPPYDKATRDLRSLLAARDAFSFDIVLEIFGELHGSDPGWADVLRRMAEGNPVFPVWMKEREKVLIKPRANRFLCSLPAQYVRSLFGRLSRDAPQHLQSLIRSFTIKTTENATRLIEQALDLNIPSLREDAIRALGCQRDDHSYRLLHEMLTSKNSRTVKPDERELAEICKAIAQHDDKNGKALLERVIRETKWLIPCWSSPIRRAAREALR